MFTVVRKSKNFRSYHFYTIFVEHQTAGVLLSLEYNSCSKRLNEIYISNAP